MDFFKVTNIYIRITYNNESHKIDKEYLLIKIPKDTFEQWCKYLLKFQNDLQLLPPIADKEGNKNNQQVLHPNGNKKNLNNPVDHKNVWGKDRKFINKERVKKLENENES